MTWLALGSALWMGVLTAISPCPLATNIAAISFISRQTGQRRAILFCGLFYTLGRTIAYVGLGIIIMAGLMATAQVSQFLQTYLNEILGPVLIILGMVLLGWIGPTLSLSLAGEGIQKRAEKGGLLWSMILGVLFALSFCPVSAGLFFAGLIPLCIQHGSRVWLPALYGVGTALPVLVFAFLLAFAANYVGKVFDKLTIVERWLRMGAGVLFIVAGIYYSLIHVFGVSM
jgi:cytochrome c-type biogenesis protein